MSGIEQKQGSRMSTFDYAASLARMESGAFDKSIAHNAATQVATFGGAKIALASPISFDPRNEFWYRLDRRVFTAFFSAKWPKFPEGDAEDALVGFALRVARVLDEAHSRGVIQTRFRDYPSRANYARLLRPIRTLLGTIENPPGWDLLQKKSLGAATAGKALQAFVDQIIADGLDAHEGRLHSNNRWFPFFDCADNATLERRSRFFVAFRHATTSTNAYRVAGAQYFAPIIGNTPTTVFLACLEAWRAGKSLAEAPLVALANDDDAASDRSHTNLVRELWGHLNLHRAPFFNKRAARYIDGVGADDPLAATLAIGHETRSFLLANPDAIRRAAARYVHAVRTARRDNDKPFAFARRAPDPGDTNSLDARLLQEIRDAGEAHLLALPPLDQACMALHLQLDAETAGFHGITTPSSTTEPAVTTSDSSPATGLRNAPRVWIFTPGVMASEWERDRAEGLASIGWDELDDLTTYESVEDICAALQEDPSRTKVPRVQARVCWQFAHDVKVGDAIVARRGRGTVIGVGVVTNGYRHRPDRSTYRHVVGVRWLSKTEHALSDTTAFAIATLVESSRRKPLLAEIEALYRDELGGAASTTEPPELSNEPFTLNDALDELFIDQAELEAMLAVLRRKKNVILQGPPGVGKTFVAQRLAWLLLEERDRTRIEVVQFHPSYTYEQFVRGYRPAAGGGFVVENGPLYRLADAARGNPDEAHVLIIDEINRAHLGRVLGEAMMLLEADKRDERWALRLAYRDSRGIDGEDERFHLPPNLYVIGTMNTADRSLAVVDYALRRRFAFLRLSPAFSHPRFREQLSEMPPALVDSLLGRLDRLNRLIREDASLGEGFVIGHSYFSTNDDARPWLADPHRFVEDVLRHEVVPLLEEYWYDAPSALRVALDVLGLRT
jgi:hypothetical protein